MCSSDLRVQPAAPCVARGQGAVENRVPECVGAHDMVWAADTKGVQRRTGRERLGDGTKHVRTQATVRCEGPSAVAETVEADGDKCLRALTAKRLRTAALHDSEQVRAGPIACCGAVGCRIPAGRTLGR